MESLVDEDDWLPDISTGNGPSADRTLVSGRILNCDCPRFVVFSNQNSYQNMRPFNESHPQFPSWFKTEIQW